MCIHLSISLKVSLKDSFQRKLFFILFYNIVEIERLPQESLQLLGVCVPDILQVLAAVLLLGNIEPKEGVGMDVDIPAHHGTLYYWQDLCSEITHGISTFSNRFSVRFIVGGNLCCQKNLQLTYDTLLIHC